MAKKDPDGDFEPSRNQANPFEDDSSTSSLSDCEEDSEDGSDIVVAQSNCDDDNGSDEEECFCICRGPDEGWMVCCDKCDEWYHGDCVDLIKEEDEEVLLMYACPMCTANGKAESVWKGGAAQKRFEARLERKARERKLVLEQVSAERNRNDEEVLKARARALLDEYEDKQITTEVTFTDPEPSADTQMTDEGMADENGDEMDVDEPTSEPVDGEEQEVDVAQTSEQDGEEKTDVEPEAPDVEQTGVFDLVNRAMVEALFGQKL